jgi:hypothetical protein
VTQPFATGLVHFAIVTQSFFGFCQTFLKFRPSATVTRSFCYNASVILRFHQLFFVILSAILRFRRALQWFSYFLISLCYVAVTQPFYEMSVILEIWSAILLISSDIFKISLNHSYDLLSYLYQLFVSFFNLQPNPYPTCVEQSVKLHLRIASETLLGSSWWTEVPWSCWREGSNRWKGLDCSGKLISSQYRPSINLNSD